LYNLRHVGFIREADRVEGTTMTTTTQVQAPPAPTDEASSTYDIAVRKIIAEIGCSKKDAEKAVAFIEDMVSKARAAARCGDMFGTHHLTYEEMGHVGYSIMDSIMPHGSPANPGSAHAAIEHHVLANGEFALIHDNPTGLREDCVVMLHVRSV